MIRVLLVGKLHNDPEARTSKNGKMFTTCKLRADTSEHGIVWCSCISFQEPAERLATLKAGQAISVAGRAKLTAWIDKAGEPQSGLDVTIDEFVTLRAKPKPKPAPSHADFADIIDDDDLPATSVH